MTDKHMPGSWKLDSNPTDYPQAVASSDGTVVALTGTDRANAKLIAAAPDMYGLLVELYDTTLDPDIVRILQPWFTKVESVIDAIEGDA